MKKRMLKILSLTMAIICMSIPAMAADTKPDWYEGGVMPRGNNVPETYNQLRLPGQSGTFSYTLSLYGEQYSDFVIVPETTAIQIKIRATTTASSHTMTLKFCERASDTVLFTDTIAVTRGAIEEIFIPYGLIEAYRGYYIELSSPSTSGATGSITVFSS